MVIAMALLGLAVAVLLKTAIGIVTGWPGDYSDRILDSGTRVKVAGVAATVVVPEDWTCRVVDYVAVPRWTRLGQGGQLGLRQAVFLTSGTNDRPLVVILSYHDDTIWRKSLTGIQARAPSLDLSGTVFEGGFAQGYDSSAGGAPAAAVYMLWKGKRGATVFNFQGAESTESSGATLVNDIAAIIRLRIEE